jgi:hypothetical protein
MLLVVGLAIVACGFAQWRYGERYNRWWLRHFRWWPGAAWHRANMNEQWYRIVFVRGIAVWFVGVGVAIVIAGTIRLVGA